MYTALHVYVSGILVLIKLEFSLQSLEKYSNFIQIRPVGAELFHVHGQTKRHDEVCSIKGPTRCAYCVHVSGAIAPETCRAKK
jgi:hypothetical protein